LRHPRGEWIVLERARLHKFKLVFLLKKRKKRRKESGYKLFTISKLLYVLDHCWIMS
jgi:hypothetical protein